MADNRCWLMCACGSRFLLLKNLGGGWWFHTPHLVATNPSEARRGAEALAEWLRDDPSGSESGNRIAKLDVWVEAHSICGSTPFRLTYEVAGPGCEEADGPADESLRGAEEAQG